jgi:hypothetical protein
MIKFNHTYVETMVYSSSYDPMIIKMMGGGLNEKKCAFRFAGKIR